MIFRGQTDLVTTKEGVLPVCDEPYHTKETKCRERGGS